VIHILDNALLVTYAGYDLLPQFTGIAISVRMLKRHLAEAMLQSLAPHNAEHYQAHNQTGVRNVHATAHRGDEHLKDVPHLIVRTLVLI